MAQRSHRRRQWSLAATLLWIAGFELAPFAHVALHAGLGEHRHEDEGVAYADEDADADADEHGDHDHDGDHDADHDEEVGQGHGQGHGQVEEREQGAAAGPYHPGHGAHSLLHRGVAQRLPALVTPEVDCSRVTFTVWPQQAPRVRAAEREYRSGSPRGPPAGRRSGGFFAA